MAHISPSLERKLICGKLHVRVMCQSCKGMVWTSAANAVAAIRYRCLTCTQPRLDRGYGKGSNEDGMEDWSLSPG
jgi:hypothetical protein